MSICVLLYITLFVLFDQVSLVQYSDDAKTEFKLNTYHDKGIVISALKSVRYRGGNTKTGTQLKKTNHHQWQKEDELFRLDVLGPLCLIQALR